MLQAMAVAVASSACGKEVSGESFLLAVGRETHVREFRTRYEIAASLLARESDWQRIADRLGHAQTALGSVVTAAYCFAKHADDFEQAVVTALSLGGNASSIGAMTGAISGARLGTGAIPRRWCEKLEQGVISVDSMRALARGCLHRSQTHAHAQNSAFESKVLYASPSSRVLAKTPRDFYMPNYEVCVRMSV